MADRTVRTQPGQWVANHPGDPRQNAAEPAGPDDRVGRGSGRDLLDLLAQGRLQHGRRGHLHFLGTAPHGLRHLPVALDASRGWRSAAAIRHEPRRDPVRMFRDVDGSRVPQLPTACLGSALLADARRRFRAAPGSGGRPRQPSRRFGCRLPLPGCGATHVGFLGGEVSGRRTGGDPVRAVGGGRLGRRGGADSQADHPRADRPDRTSSAKVARRPGPPPRPIRAYGGVHRERGGRAPLRPKEAPTSTGRRTRKGHRLSASDARGERHREGPAKTEERRQRRGGTPDGIRTRDLRRERAMS